MTENEYPLPEKDNRGRLLVYAAFGLTVVVIAYLLWLWTQYYLGA